MADPAHVAEVVVLRCHYVPHGLVCGSRWGLHVVALSVAVVGLTVAFLWLILAYKFRQRSS
jgi:hypothetical protein